MSTEPQTENTNETQMNDEDWLDYEAYLGETDERLEDVPDSELAELGTSHKNIKQHEFFDYMSHEL